MSTSQPPLFIVSTGRCGSTMLSRMLALHPEVASLSEFFTCLFPHTFERSSLDGAGMWQMLSAPRLNHRIWIQLVERGIPIDELRYPIAGLARYREVGIPPLLTMTLTELSDDPEALHEELGEYVTSLPRSGRAPSTAAS
jgi:putative sulfotransferase